MSMGNTEKSALQSNVPTLVAHRGESHRYPENTLLAMKQALQLGCRYLECDIQLSSDACPMVFHDKTLNRTTAQSGLIWERTAAELTRISAGYPAHFGETFLQEKIPRLEELVALLQDWPEARVLVEIKRASMHKFGREVMLAAIMRELQSVQRQCSLISYDMAVLQLAKRRYGQASGWVFDQLDDSIRVSLAEMKHMDLLITDADNLDPHSPWPEGNWQWVLFEVNQPEQALRWGERGVSFIETNQVEAYLSHAEFFPSMRSHD